MLDSVRSTSRGRLVLVTGEAGAGKTALARRFADEQRASARILWGACDALFTPRALGPLLDVAEETGGDLAQAAAGDAGPHEVANALLRELGRRAPDDPRHRGPALGRRGHPRRRAAAGPEGRHGAGARARHLPRRRARPAPPAARRARRAGHGASNIARCELPRLSPEAVAQLAEPHGIDADELYRRTAGNPFFLSEVLAERRPRDPADRARRGPRPRGAPERGRRRRCSARSSVSQPQAELWLLEALASGAAARVPGRVPRLGHAGVDDRRRRLPPRAGADDDRGDARAPPPGRAAPRRARGARRPAGRRARIPRGSPTTPRPPATPTPCSSSRPAAAARADVGRRAPPGGGPVRAGAALRRRAAAGAAGRPPRGPLPLRLPRRRLRRGDRGDARGARRPPYAGRSVARGRQDAPALGHPLLPRRPLRGSRAARPRRRDRARGARERARARPGLREHGQPVHEPRGRRRHAGLGRSRAGVGRPHRRRRDPRARAEHDGHDASCSPGISPARDEARAQHRARAGGRAGGRRRAGLRQPRLGGAAQPRLRDSSTRRWPPASSYCAEPNLDLWRLYLQGFQSRSQLDQGRWTEAAETASVALGDARTSSIPRILAGVSLGARARAARRSAARRTRSTRRWPWRRSPRSCSASRRSPRRARRSPGCAAIATASREATEAALQLASELRRSRGRRRAGAVAPARGDLRGDRRRRGRALRPAARRRLEARRGAWAAIGRPYEAALALADGDGTARRRALDQLHELGAAPAAAIVARGLRARGARGLRRGPRPRHARATRRT